MRNLVLLAGVFVLIATGCQSADKQVPEIASDFCACFTDMEKDMSTQTKDIMHKAAISNDPENSMKSDVEALSDDDKMKVGTEMMSLGSMQDKDSEVGRCMEDVAKKYDKAKTFNEKKFMEKLIKELDEKPSCRFTADLMRIGLKTQEK
jgi:hypothetical protein